MNCPTCGAVLDTSAVFCTSCGNRIAQAPPSNHTPPPPYAPPGGYQPHQGGYQPPNPGGYPPPRPGSYPPPNQPGYGQPPRQGGDQPQGNRGVMAAKQAFGSPAFLIYVCAYLLTTLLGLYSSFSLSDLLPNSGYLTLTSLCTSALPLAWGICALVLFLSARATDNQPIKCLGGLQGLSVTYLVFVCILTFVTVICGFVLLNNDITYALRRYLGSSSTTIISALVIIVLVAEAIAVIIWSAQAAFFRNAKNAALMGTPPVKANMFLIVMYFIGAAGSLISAVTVLASPLVSVSLVLTSVCSVVTMICFPLTLLQYNHALLAPSNRPTTPNAPPNYKPDF